MPFLPPNQQRQSTEGIAITTYQSNHYQLQEMWQSSCLLNCRTKELLLPCTKGKCTKSPNCKQMHNAICMLIKSELSVETETHWNPCWRDREQTSRGLRNLEVQPLPAASRLHQLCINTRTLVCNSSARQCTCQVTTSIFLFKNGCTLPTIFPQHFYRYWWHQHTYLTTEHTVCTNSHEYCKSCSLRPTLWPRYRSEASNLAICQCFRFENSWHCEL